MRFDNVYMYLFLTIIFLLTSICDLDGLSVVIVAFLVCLFLTYAAEFVLILAVLANSVLPMG